MCHNGTSIRKLTVGISPITNGMDIRKDGVYKCGELHIFNSMTKENWLKIRVKQEIPKETWFEYYTDRF